MFRWVLGEDTVRMELYESSKLPQHWASIDGFENSGFDYRIYKKMYVPVTVEGQPSETLVASLFANAKS